MGKRVKDQTAQGFRVGPSRPEGGDRGFEEMKGTQRGQSLTLKRIMINASDNPLDQKIWMRNGGLGKKGGKKKTPRGLFNNAANVPKIR